MQTIPLHTQAISKDASAKNVRSEGKVPCVLYGNDVEHTQFACEYSELYRVYAKAGESVIVDLDLNGKKVPSLFYELQFEPVSDRIVHVDFYAVDMKKEIEARVPISFVGESEAVKSSAGIMVHVMDHLTIKCLPANLPQHLDADISTLKEFGDAILVSDIKLPANVEVLEEQDAMIATVQEPRREVVEETPAEGEATDAQKKEAGEGENKEDGAAKAE